MFAIIAKMMMPFVGWFATRGAGHRGCLWKTICVDYIGHSKPCLASLRVCRLVNLYRQSVGILACKGLSIFYAASFSIFRSAVLLLVFGAARLAFSLQFVRLCRVLMKVLASFHDLAVGTSFGYDKLSHDRALLDRVMLWLEPRRDCTSRRGLFTLSRFGLVSNG